MYFFVQFVLWSPLLLHSNNQFVWEFSNFPNKKNPFFYLVIISLSFLSHISQAICNYQQTFSLAINPNRGEKEKAGTRKYKKKKTTTTPVSMTTAQTDNRLRTVKASETNRRRKKNRNRFLPFLTFPPKQTTVIFVRGRSSSLSLV